MARVWRALLRDMLTSTALRDFECRLVLFLACRISRVATRGKKTSADRAANKQGRTSYVTGGSSRGGLSQVARNISRKRALREMPATPFTTLTQLCWSLGSAATTARQVLMD